MDRDRIIVLRKIVYRDSDLIIRGLNSQGAKVSYLAPSGLRSRKRFGGGVLEPCNFIEVIYQGSLKSTVSSNPLRRIKEAQVIKEFLGVRRSYDLIQLSLSLLALIDQVGQEGDAHGEGLFNLLGHSLKYLSLAPEGISKSLFRLHFLLKFLFQQGVLNCEPWMSPYLKTSIRDHNELIILSVQVEESWILDRLIVIENLVQNYRETGASN